MTEWVLPRHRPRRPAIMGIVNVTPDSFSDGGRTFDPTAAVAHAMRLVEEGADLLDIGGESTRPGAEPVSADEELRRVIPVIEAVRAQTDRPISVDTTKAAVAKMALERGADVVNDISALRFDPELLPVLARNKCGVVLMHMRGEPRTMQEAPSYGDVVEEVFAFLADRVDLAERTGIDRSRIAIDPGIGFGKTIEHNLELLRNLPRFRTIGCAVLVGTSRKRFLGTLTGRDVSDRLTGSVVSALAALDAGADVVRVHDVAPMRDAIQVWAAHRGWNEP